MRLNPFSVQFLGLLPLQKLIMFQREIYPLVCWNKWQERFHTNREVEKVIYIPIKDLLKPDHYACFRLRTDDGEQRENKGATQDFLCYLHAGDERQENLWGATFRITMNFLEIVFGFKPPDLQSLPVIEGSLDKNYLTGHR